jgi:hypothetical protein
MEIDYIRLYQDSDDELHTLGELVIYCFNCFIFYYYLSSHKSLCTSFSGCSPDPFPTKEYINKNYHKYANWEPYTSNNNNNKNISNTIFNICITVIILICLILLYINRLRYPIIKLNKCCSRHEYTPINDDDPIIHL